MRKSLTAVTKALLIAGTLAAGGVQAQTCVWTGNVDSDWHTPGNWDGNAVPGVDETAVIPSGTVVLAQPAPPRQASPARCIGASCLRRAA